ncbi:MAG TPA: DUF6079 family protein [Blastocatellia bacterium]|nr:DUF6079 family protein [Blastocatellia bacterium]
MAQIKNYVDLESYDEMTTFAGADAERVVRSYVVTEETAALAAEILDDLVAPRGAAPTIQLVSGRRGIGKSHLLAFLRALLSTRSLRSIPRHPRLQNPISRLSNRTLFAVELNFAADEQTAFETALRAALNAVLVEGAGFDDQRWRQAVEREQVFEQTLSLMSLDAHLVLFIDQLSGRWHAAPELIEDDLKWLKMIARQSESLPLRAIIALDERDYAARLENYGLMTGQPPVIVREMPPQILSQVIARGVLVKKPDATAELSALYQQIKRSLPGFAWGEEEFIAYYPVHPALETLAPAIRAHTRNFSLPGFTATTVTRAINRPAMSLVATDELFDRYEYELRKNAATADVFALYDRINAEALSGLSVEDRLWAKMLAKALTLFLLTDEPVTVQTLAGATLMFEGSSASESGCERAARILSHFEACAPETIYVEGAAEERQWQRHVVPPPVPLREQLTLAAREISADDPRLGSLLISVGGNVFADWNAAEFSAVGIGATDSGAGRILRPESNFREITWRGTTRRGRICTGRVEADQFEAGDHTLNAGDLLGAGIGAEDHTRNPESGADWRLLIVHFNSTLKPEAPASSPCGLRWHPGVITEEDALEPLRLFVALDEHPAREDEAGSEEARRITAELSEQIRQLFVRLYLERGTFVDHHGPRPLLPGCEPAAGFGELLSREIRAAFDSFYPDHPHFDHNFTSEHVLTLLTELFASSSPGNERTRELAARFAAPLGLVSESRGKFRLNVFNEAANLPPFIHALVTLVEIHADAEGRSDVPLPKVTRLLSASPYGLPLAAQHLILVAFISSGVYELIDETTGRRLTKANLHLGFEPSRFTTLRRVATTDYPLDILHTWSRRLTGRDDLPALISPDARQTVRDALADWLEQWREQNLRERFEELPADLMTMTTWHTVNMSIRRYERAAALVETILEDALTIETGLSRILDLFGLDIAALEQAWLKMQSLASFLDWLPMFMQIRNYLLSAETTGEEKIDQELDQLLAGLRELHELLMSESRQQLELAFDDYRESYSRFYTAAHEASVGPKAYTEMIESFYASSEWQTFKLLTQLKLDGRAFESDARMLTELVDKTRCDLPIADILQRQPHCGCSFRLNRRLNLGSILDAFRSLTRAASACYSEEIWKHREELRRDLRDCADEALAGSVSSFIRACGEGQTEGLTQEVVSFLNEHLPDPPLVAVLPEIPRFDDGSFTREQLRENLNRWIDSLPEEEGLRFRVERA